jgi:hypothetical protein
MSLWHFNSPLAGRRYRLPKPVAAALHEVFLEPLDEVRVIEHSRYARLHRGMVATTRPNRILLAISGAAFIAQPDILIHEYFHVLRQWRTGRLTRAGYLLESLRRGYWDNRFEQEARAFTAAAVPRYRRLLVEAMGEAAPSRVKSGLPPTTTSTPSR